MRKFFADCLEKQKLCSYKNISNILYAYLILSVSPHLVPLSLKHLTSAPPPPLPGANGNCICTLVMLLSFVHFSLHHQHQIPLEIPLHPQDSLGLQHFRPFLNNNLPHRSLVPKRHSRYKHQRSQLAVNRPAMHLLYPRYSLVIFC